jgi:hypothetical protein
MGPPGKTPLSKAKIYMDISRDDNPVFTEEMWRAWVRKGRLREQAGVRRRRVRFGIAVVILAIGAGFYTLMLK